MLVRNLSHDSIYSNSYLSVLQSKVDRGFVMPPSQKFLRWFQQSTSKTCMSSESSLRKASAASKFFSTIRRRIFLAPVYVPDVKAPSLSNLPIFIYFGSRISCWYEGCECSNSSVHRCNQFLHPVMVGNTVSTCCSDVSTFRMMEVESMRGHGCYSSMTPMTKLWRAV